MVVVPGASRCCLAANHPAMSHRYGENDLAFHRVRIAAFTTTERALIRLAYASGSARGLYDGPLIASALTCYALRFVELTAALVPVYAPHLCGIY